MPKQAITAIFYVESQYNLAIMYKDGEGTPKDCALAVKWYTTAAEQGCLQAEQTLADFFTRTEPAWQKTVAQAAKFYRLAAAQGDPSAQNHLGSYFMMGRGLPKDDNQAVYWYKLAAEGGDALGQFNLSQMYRDGIVVQKGLC